MPTHHRGSVHGVTSAATATRIRAAVCREFGQPLTIEELDLAPPAKGQIQVKLGASAVCHSDVHFFEGAWGGDLPAVWGHEAAGWVVAIGEGVDGFAIGDHVVVTLIRSCGRCRNCQAGVSVSCSGNAPAGPSPLTDADGKPVVHGLGCAAFAEQVVIDQSQAVVIDRDLDLALAALLACGVITGVGAALNTAAIEPGSTVVVIGTGGVGLNAVQGARLAGATTIIAVDINDAKLTTAREFGATVTVNSTSTELTAAVADITDGAMADYVLVTVGAKAPIENAPALLAANGVVVVVGMPASGVMATIDPGTIAAMNQSILGSKMGRATISRDIPALIEKYRTGELLLDELVTKTCTLDEINEAFDSVISGDAVRNVIIFSAGTDTNSEA